jgi:hypothetical protein
MIDDFGFEIQDLRFWVLGLGFRILGKEAVKKIERLDMICFGSSPACRVNIFIYYCQPRRG